MKILKLISGTLCFLALLGCVSTVVDKSEQEEIQEMESIEIEEKDTTMNGDTSSVEEEKLVKDVGWDLAIDYSTKRDKTYYLVDFDENIAVKFFKRSSKISGVEFGTASGSLDDTLNITFLDDNGKEWHQYFAWAHPDIPNNDIIYRLNSKGEPYDYEIWSPTLSISSAIDYIKNYKIPETFEIGNKSVD